MDGIRKVEIHEVITCNLDDSIKEVARKLKHEKERRIFVVDENNNLKGIITTTDLVYKGMCDEKNLKAREVMTSDVKFVDVKEDLNKALEIMNELKTFTCPVVEDGKILGIISYHDLMGYVISSVEK